MTSTQPYTEEWLQFEQMAGGRFNLTGDIASIRTQFLGLFNNMKNLLPPPNNTVEAIDMKLPGSTMAVRIYSPVEKVEQLLPVALYIHSGGWVAGGVDYEDHVCRYFVQHTPTILVCPDYRLAPEHVFPAGLEDCFQAYKWMSENIASYGANPSLSYVIGGSAGGNLAIAMALKIVSTPGLNPPKAVISSCLSTCEPSVIPEKYQKDWHPEEFLDAAFLDRKCMETCIAAYGPPPADPLFSVLLHPDLAKLPPTYLVACGKDPTHDEIFMLRDEMTAQGCEVKLREYKGYPHFFFIVPMLRASQEYLDDIVAKIREMVISSSVVSPSS